MLEPVVGRFMTHEAPPDAIEVGDNRWVEIRFRGTYNKIRVWDAELWGHDRETGFPLRLQIVEEGPRANRYALVWTLYDPPKGPFGLPLEREVRLTEYMPLREAKKRAIAFLSRITSLKDQEEWDERIRQALLKKYGLANPRRNAEQIELFEQVPTGEVIPLGDGRRIEIRFVGTTDKVNEWEALLWGHDKETGLPLRLKIVQEKPRSSRYAVVWRLSTPPRGVFDLPLKQDVLVSGYVPLREAKKRAVEILSKIHTRQQEQEYEERLRQYISRLHGGKNPRLPDVTDRALRYRANRAIAQREVRCIYCGRPDGWLEVDHINGYEEDNSPENLAWACRACNTQKGAVFARAGIGRRTRQFNPRARKRAARATRGAGTLAEWMEAVMALKGYPSRFTLQEAIEKVRATPPEDRSAFAHEIWRRRRARGTDRRVPF
jgi:5-methylcytosine-specific restriction endonuclease McrA